MSVYDKPDDVVQSIDSVLSQSNVELELVVVSDGATPAVKKQLQQFNDPRLRVIEQDNQGLTKALIQGCATAKYDIIARLDAGDCMLSGRLEKQATYLQRHPQAALVSCWVQMHTQEGYPLYEVRHSAQELMAGLRAQNQREFKSPVHASTMFRKSAYLDVGGYREQFYFAQDCDLWARLLAKYDLGVVPEPLQRCVFSASGISGQHRGAQKKLAKLVVQANKLRAQGESDASVLGEASKLRPVVNTPLSSDKAQDQAIVINNGEFEGNYFIASVLSNTQPLAALIYWRKALGARPWNLKARCKFVLCWLRALTNKTL